MKSLFCFVLSILVGCVATVDVAAAKKPFQSAPERVIVLGLRGRSINLENRSEALIIFAGPVAGAIQSSSSAGSRLPLGDALNERYPTFRPERILAEEVAKVLRENENFKNAEITVSDAKVELPIAPKYRAAEEKPFVPNWVNRSDWIRASKKWQDAPLTFPHLNAQQISDPGLVSVEFAMGCIRLNFGDELYILTEFRCVSPSGMCVLASYSDAFGLKSKIFNIESKEGIERFESEFRRVASELARKCIKKAFK